jgi:ketosteroid isomerase-like protein
MESRNATAPQDVLYQVHEAQNRHDLDAFVGCFSPDFDAEQPVHPGVEFAGREQVRKNWSLLFAHVPDFRSELLSSAMDGDTVWAEWRWYGNQSNGKPHDTRGVMIFQVQGGLIVHAKLYMEPVQAQGSGIEAQLGGRLRQPS